MSSISASALRLILLVVHNKHHVSDSQTGSGNVGEAERFTLDQTLKKNPQKRRKLEKKGGKGEESKRKELKGSEVLIQLPVGLLWNRKKRPVRGGDVMDWDQSVSLCVCQ